MTREEQDEIFKIAKRLARQMQRVQRNADIKILEDYIDLSKPGYFRSAQKLMVNHLKKHKLVEFPR